MWLMAASAKLLSASCVIRHVPEGSHQHESLVQVGAVPISEWCIASTSIDLVGSGFRASQKRRMPDIVSMAAVFCHIIIQATSRVLPIAKSAVPV
jgi:hypothetical protein